MYAPESQPGGIPFLMNGPMTVSHTYDSSKTSTYPRVKNLAYLRSAKRIDFRSLLRLDSDVKRGNGSSRQLITRFKYPRSSFALCSYVCSANTRLLALNPSSSLADSEPSSL